MIQDIRSSQHEAGFIIFANYVLLTRLLAKFVVSSN